MRITASIEEISEPADIFKIVDKKQLNVFYLVPGIEPFLAQISKFASHKKIVLISGEDGHATTGAGVCLLSREGKPKIVVNLGAVTSQGAKIDGSLLLLSEIIDRKPRFQKWEEVLKRRTTGRDPRYPKMARTAKLEATLAVKITIAHDGNVRKVKFLKTSEHFESEVRSAINSWKFAPYLVDNNPVATYTVYKTSFKLR